MATRCNEVGELQQLWTLPDPELQRNPCHLSHGLIYAAVAGIVYGLCTVTVKLAETNDSSTAQIVFTQNVLCVLAMIPFILHQQLPIVNYPKRDKGLLILNGVIEAIGRISLYYAFRYGLVGNVSSITFGTLPIITACIARIFLGEKWNFVDAVNTILNVAGIVLITGPSFMLGNSSDESGHDSTNNLAISTVLSIVTAVLLAISAVAIRSLRTDVHITVILFYVGAIGSVVIFPGLLISNVDSWHGNLYAWVYTCVQAICYILASLAVMSALHMEQAPTVILLVNIQICVAYIGDVTIFSENVKFWEIIGAALILGSSAIVAVYKWWNNRKNCSEVS
ncbi:solute carrier family 35 member G1-like [Saccoglossus kowalevskii]|uniref:Solute carrier family 35 member G1-like n=1 Tax=Saccoglossus kowalevskii TaxID=10224 RepID=A0ABM0MXS6_SACKO|nr:PREDICTED: solute carrier family 35 member G1-like [Saccoglossus kowalevskii]